MDLSNLATLKRKLRYEQTLSNIFEYFLDHFGDKPAFAALGHQTSNEFIESFLTESSAEWFGKKMQPTGLLLVSIPEHDFIHGGCILGVNMVNLIYFEDINMGLIVMASGGNFRKTNFMRFTVHKLPKDFGRQN